MLVQNRCSANSDVIRPGCSGRNEFKMETDCNRGGFSTDFEFPLQSRARPDEFPERLAVLKPMN